MFWLNVYFFLLVQTIDLSSGFLPITVGSLYIFLYFTLLHFTFSSILRPFATIYVRILNTSVLNFASDRLAISLPLSCIFSGALISSFIWVFFLFFFFLPRQNSHVVRGGALGIHQVRATQVAVLWCCMWGRGPRGNPHPHIQGEQCRLYSSLPAFSHFPQYTQANWALLALIPGWVVLYMF